MYRQVVKTWVVFKLEVQTTLRYRYLILERDQVSILPCNFFCWQELTFTRSVKHGYCTVIVGSQAAEENSFVIKKEICLQLRRVARGIALLLLGWAPG